MPCVGIEPTIFGLQIRCIASNAYKALFYLVYNQLRLRDFRVFHHSVEKLFRCLVSIKRFFVVVLAVEGVSHFIHSCLSLCYSYNISDSLTNVKG